MQEIIFNRPRNNNNHNHSQFKSNKYFEYQLNRNQQSDKSCHLSNFEKKNKLKSNFEKSAQNKRTHAKIKNEKNNRYFECHKLSHYHRNCSNRNK